MYPSPRLCLCVSDNFLGITMLFVTAQPVCKSTQSVFIYFHVNLLSLSLPLSLSVCLFPPPLSYHQNFSELFHPHLITFHMAPRLSVFDMPKVCVCVCECVCVCVSVCVCGKCCDTLPRAVNMCAHNFELLPPSPHTPAKQPVDI